MTSQLDTVVRNRLTSPKGSRGLLKPSIITILRYWIIFVVLLVAISPTDIPLLYRFYAIFVYFALFWYVFVPRKKSRAHVQPVRYHPSDNKIILLLIVFQFISVSICINYYTGSSIISAISSLASGNNAYGLYQEHFSEEGIALSSGVSRSGYIVLLSYAKFVFLLSIVNFFLSPRRNIASLASLILSSCIYISFGLARGTFFECFEVSCAILYFWHLCSFRVMPSSRKVHRSARFRYSIAIGSVALLAMFLFNAGRRYDDPADLFQQCSSNFCFRPWGVSSYLEHSIYLLTVYFGNGVYFLCRLFDETLTGHELLYLLPAQSVLNNEFSEFGIKGFMCSKYLSCNFVWAPDVSSLISIFGVLAILLVSILLYLFETMETFIISRFNIYGACLLYLMFMYAISLPVANFFTVSTPSIVLSIILVLILMIRRLSKAAPGQRGRHG